MIRSTMFAALAAAAIVCTAPPARAQEPDAASIAAQREAVAKLAWTDGVWRGTATITTREGVRKIVHTERVGPMLDGTLRVVEGRSYEADGSVAFNAFGIFSYDPRTKAYAITSWAQGYSGTNPLEVTADGYVWGYAAGPGRMTYTATFRDGVWREVGDFAMPGAPAMRVFEMELRRVGTSDWPAAGAVPKD